MAICGGAYEDYCALASGGALCRGEGCGGWILSDLDTYHKCGCGRGTDANHPEYYQDEEEGCEAPVEEVAVKATPLNFVVTFKASDDDILF